MIYWTFPKYLVDKGAETSIKIRRGPVLISKCLEGVRASRLRENYWGLPTNYLHVLYQNYSYNCHNILNEILIPILD